MPTYIDLLPCIPLRSDSASFAGRCRLYKSIPVCTLSLPPWPT